MTKNEGLKVQQRKDWEVAGLEYEIPWSRSKVLPSSCDTRWEEMLEVIPGH